MRIDRRIHACYGILIGLFIGGFWGALYLTGGIPEIHLVPLEIGYHLVAELLTAGALVVAGSGLLLDRSWATRLYAVALGMLLYTLINSSGYYAQLGDLIMVGMFTVLFIATLVSIVDIVVLTPRPRGTVDQTERLNENQQEDLDV